jgi:hypothetical protein
MKKDGSASFRRRGRTFGRVALSLCLAAQLSCGLWSRDDGGAAEGRPAPHFRPGFNLFSPEQDVELGRMSAQEIARQVPIMSDEPTVNYVRQLGARLAAKAPGHAFPYQFAVVGTRDINAFALPGGFIFVNAGAITAAKTEGELAGVVAHEIAHVALRHGTNQASKAYVAKRGIGILGSVFGDGDRVAAINEIVPSLQMSPKPVRDSQEFKAVKSRLSGASAVKTAKEPARVGPRDPNDNEAGTRPAPPAGELREFRAEDGSFTLRYPSNWDALGIKGDDTNLVFAPKGAYGQRDGAVFATHGVFVGVVAPRAQDLAAANAAFVRQQIEANPDFRPRREPERVESAGRVWYRTLVSGPSAVTGVVELDVIYTTATQDGRLFYLITMAPEDEFQTYQPSFEQIIASLQLGS